MLKRHSWIWIEIHVMIVIISWLVIHLPILIFILFKYCEIMVLLGSRPVGFRTISVLCGGFFILYTNCKFGYTLYFIDFNIFIPPTWNTPKQNQNSQAHVPARYLKCKKATLIPCIFYLESPRLSKKRRKKQMHVQSMKNVIALIGSATTSSANHKLMEYIQSEARNTFQVTFYDRLKTLPHFDPELSLEHTRQKLWSYAILSRMRMEL